MEVTNLRWADAAMLWIDCTIAHPEHGPIPFTASPNDTEALSRAVFASAIEGDYGPIAPYEPPPAAPVTPADVEAERDRRIAAGVAFKGKLFQTGPEDEKHIQGAFSLAAIAAVTGAQAGDYYWHGGTHPFAWITADNSLTPLDAHDVVSLGRLAAGHRSAHIFAARALKDLAPIPADFANDGYWPAEPQ